MCVCVLISMPGAHLWEARLWIRVCLSVYKRVGGECMDGNVFLSVSVSLCVYTNIYLPFQVLS